MIGQAIDSSIEERRLMADRAEVKRDRQLKRNILNYNYAQKMAQDMDDLNIMPSLIFFMGFNKHIFKYCSHFFIFYII